MSGRAHTHTRLRDVRNKIRPETKFSRLPRTSPDIIITVVQYYYYSLLCVMYAQRRRTNEYTYVCYCVYSCTHTRVHNMCLRTRTCTYFLASDKKKKKPCTYDVKNCLLADRTEQDRCARNESYNYRAFNVRTKFKTHTNNYCVTRKVN